MQDAQRLARSTVESSIGRIALRATAQGLVGLEFDDRARAPDASDLPADAAAWRHADAAARALDAYFEGQRRSFADLVLAPAGTPFQRRVWEALCAIPFGATESYGGLARAIGAPGAARAVGLANHRNPIGIVIPCHRVIGTDGSLTGYGGGLARKRWLLTHEGALPPPLLETSARPEARG